MTDLRRSEAAFHAFVVDYLVAQTGRPASVFTLDANLVRDRLVDSLTFVLLLDQLDQAGWRLPVDGFELDAVDTIRKLYAQAEHDAGSGG